MSPETVEKKVQPVDPINFTDQSKSGSLLMISAAYGQIVPKGETQRLKNAWGNPREIEVEADHSTIVLYSKHLLGEVKEHFFNYLK